MTWRRSGWALGLCMAGCVEWARVDGATGDVPVVDRGTSADIAAVDAGTALDAPAVDGGPPDVAPPTDEGAAPDRVAIDVGTSDVATDRPVGVDLVDAGSPIDRPTTDAGPTDAGVDAPPPECTAGMTRPCYTGPSAAAGVGICTRGTQRCAGSVWATACEGEVMPRATEICGNGLDDNCSGTPDEGCAVTCAAGTSDCNGLVPDACEVVHATAKNACASATDLGTFCGDDSCGATAITCTGTSWRSVRSVTGVQAAWYRGRITDCSGSCGANVVGRLTLAVPPGVDYDLYVHRPCGSVVASSTAGGAGVTEQVTLSQPDGLTSTDSFDYVVEVRHRGGASCMPWTLSLEARANSATTCP